MSLASWWLFWAHGSGEVRKKKLGFFRTWKKILVLIRSSLDWVSASRLRNWVGFETQILSWGPSGTLDLLDLIQI